MGEDAIAAQVRVTFKKWHPIGLPICRVRSARGAGLSICVPKASAPKCSCPPVCVEAKLSTQSAGVFLELNDADRQLARPTGQITVTPSAAQRKSRSGTRTPVSRCSACVAFKVSPAPQKHSKAFPSPSQSQSVCDIPRDVTEPPSLTTFTTARRTTHVPSKH